MMKYGGEKLTTEMDSLCDRVWKENFQEEWNKQRKEEETLVRYKSADNYAGRPNKWINTKR